MQRNAIQKYVTQRNTQHAIFDCPKTQNTQNAESNEDDQTPKCRMTTTQKVKTQNPDTKNTQKAKKKKFDQN
jgi:hypothetical protein